MWRTPLAKKRKLYVDIHVPESIRNTIKAKKKHLTYEEYFKAIWDGTIKYGY
jgi:hypothetical protein